MKKYFALIAIICMLPATASAKTTTRVSPSHQNQHRMSVGAADGDADIDPFSRIRARVTVLDDGMSDTINGYGSGFDAALSYISFFYGTGSVSKGSLACLPPTPNNLSAAQMVVGYWLPVGSSQRTLQVVKSATSLYPYVPIGMVDTMSVRYDTTPTLSPLVNLNPGRFYLNSCGKLKP